MICSPAGRFCVFYVELQLLVSPYHTNHKSLSPQDIHVKYLINLFFYLISINSVSQILSSRLDFHPKAAYYIITKVTVQ